MTEIPLMTDPLGRYWEQPLVKDILVDDTHAIMTTKTFEELADYTYTNPSGVYPGKMWKGRMVLCNTKTCPITYYYSNNRWELRWWGISDKGENFCSNNQREILLID